MVFPADVPTPNLVDVKLSPAGTIKLYNHFGTGTTGDTGDTVTHELAREEKGDGGEVIARNLTAIFTPDP